MGVYCRKMDFFSSSLPFRLLRTLVSNWWTTDKKSNVTIFAVPWNMRSLKVTRKKTPLSLWLFAVSFLLNRSWSIVVRRKLRQCKGVFCDVRAFYCDRMRWLHFYTLFIFTNEMRFFSCRIHFGCCWAACTVGLFNGFRSDRKRARSSHSVRSHEDN